MDISINQNRLITLEAWISGAGDAKTKESLAQDVATRVRPVIVLSSRGQSRRAEGVSP